MQFSNLCTDQGVRIITGKHKDIDWRGVVGHTDACFGPVLRVVVADYSRQSSTQNLNQDGYNIYI